MTKATPYDTALRLRQRELDEVGSAIRSTVEELDRITGARAAAADAILRESTLSDSELVLAAPLYIARKRAERSALALVEQEVGVRLDGLREQALQALGSKHAIEGAASGYREQAARAQAGNEQAAADDLAAIAYLKVVRERSARGWL